MPTIAVTGASGFVGRAVVRAALERGMRVIALGRSPQPGTFPAGVESRAFDPTAPNPDPQVFAGADAVVHLAGETVDGRWTPEKKQRIRESRVAGTRAVVDAMASCANGPRTLISASGTGYYGSREDEPLFEYSAPGADFLANVCSAWEREAMRARSLGIRTAVLRTGIALGDGGALEKMRAPFAFGAGGPLGSGRQFMPWIHVDDLASLYCFAVENAYIEGPINAVAPDYATNARVAQAIGTAMRRPSLLPAPAFALRLVLGEFADSVLGSQLVIPAAAQDAGFAWRHTNLERALQSILAPGREASTIHRFESTQVVAADIRDVFGFFADARNLEAITPPLLRFKIDRISGTMERGAVIDYRLRLHGAPLKWKTLIAQWDPPHAFVDVQLHGPYASWRHEHRLREVPGGVEIADAVDYVLPYQSIGNAVLGFVQRDVEQIFRYRAEVIARRFPDPRVSAAV